MKNLIQKIFLLSLIICSHSPIIAQDELNRKRPLGQNEEEEENKEEPDENSQPDIYCVKKRKLEKKTPMKERSQWPEVSEESIGLIYDFIDNFSTTPIKSNSRKHGRSLINESKRSENILQLIAARRRYYIKNSPLPHLPLLEWIEKGKIINKNRAISKIFEQGSIERLGLNNNNFKKSDSKKRAYSITTKKGKKITVTTRPDAIGTRAIVEHKHMSSKANNKVFYDTDQLKAQREMCKDPLLTKYNGNKELNHILIKTTDLEDAEENWKSWNSFPFDVTKYSKIFYFDIWGNNQNVYLWLPQAENNQTLTDKRENHWKLLDEQEIEELVGEPLKNPVDGPVEVENKKDQESKDKD